MQLIAALLSIGSFASLISAVVCLVNPRWVGYESRWYSIGFWILSLVLGSLAGALVAS